MTGVLIRPKLGAFKIKIKVSVLGLPVGTVLTARRLWIGNGLNEANVYRDDLPEEIKDECPEGKALVLRTGQWTYA